MIAAVPMIALIGFMACSRMGGAGIAMDMGAVPYAQLSEYGFFKGDMAALQPVESVVPYDLSIPLFTDYAQKERFVYIPEGVSATYQENDVFEFPVGSVLIKNFLYADDMRAPTEGRRVIETRLLIRKEDGWFPATYVWDDAQQEAQYSVVGKALEVSWTHSDGAERTANYRIPNKNECKGCHSIDKAFAPIGPKARFMNRSLVYEAGEMNQLDQWVKLGMLVGVPNSNEVPSLPLWSDMRPESVAAKARGYLDINCSHCHNPRGPADYSGLLLDGSHESEMVQGICKPPIATGQGSGGFIYDIVPGKPEESILVHRMASLERGTAMPEIGRSLVHEEGLELVKTWIRMLEGDCVK